MEDRVDLKKFLQILRRRMITIVLTSLSLLLITVSIVIFAIKPTYEATEYILVGELNRSEENYAATQDIGRILASSLDLIKSPVILESVNNQLDSPVDNLSEKISLQNNEDSQVINVIVRDHNPETARQIASTVAETAVTDLNESYGVNHIQVLGANSEGVVPQRVGSTALNLAIGVLVSIFFGTSIGMFREGLDNTFKNRRELESTFNCRVLGEIDLKNNKNIKNEQMDESMPEGQRGEFGNVQKLEH